MEKCLCISRTIGYIFSLILVSTFPRLNIVDIVLGIPLYHGQLPLYQ